MEGALVCTCCWPTPTVPYRMDRMGAAIRVGNKNPLVDGVTNPICKNPLGPTSDVSTTITCNANAKKGRFLTIEVADEFVTFCEIEVRGEGRGRCVLGGRCSALHVQWDAGWPCSCLTTEVSGKAENQVPKMSCDSCL